MQLILASSSPRRQQMMRDLGVSFKIISPDIREQRKPSERAAHYVKRLAEEKARCVYERIQKDSKKIDNVIVLAADTVVAYRDVILEKPRDKTHALKMLLMLNGTTHDVYTAFCWLKADKKDVQLVSQIVKTRVRFLKRPRSFWQWYVSTGEPMDKAGAYAAQGCGMSFIECIEGSYSNVVGLPLPQVLLSFEKNFGEKLFSRVFRCH